MHGYMKYKTCWQARLTNSLLTLNCFPGPFPYLECMSSLCCSQKRQDHFVRSKLMCEISLMLAPLRLTNVQVALCSEISSSNPRRDRRTFFLFFFLFFHITYFNPEVCTAGISKDTKKSIGNVKDRKKKHFDVFRNLLLPDTTILPAVKNLG